MERDIALPCQTVKCRSTIQRELTDAFPGQQRLREIANVLRFIHITCVVKTVAE